MSAPTEQPTPNLGLFDGKELPKSCIESAAHAIQCMNGNKFEPWVDENTTTEGVGVWAVFGNRMICINRVEELSTELTGVTENEKMVKQLQTGRGIAIANTREDDQRFNMHFGAVIAGNLTSMTVTDISEDGIVENVPVNSGNVIVTNSSYLKKRFRGEDYTDPDVYKIGLLISEKDKEFESIKSNFQSADIRDYKKSK